MPHARWQMTDMHERMRSAIERVLGEPVKAFTRREWEDSLRPGGVPTRLPRPFSPYRSVEQRPEYMSCVASGMNHTASVGGDEGFHVVRLDLKDAPNFINTDSYTLLGDLAGHAKWAEILTIAGLKAGPEVEGVLGLWVFARGPGRRPDHHAPGIPQDIAEAQPKSDSAPPP